MLRFIFVANLGLKKKKLSNRNSRFFSGTAVMSDFIESEAEESEEEFEEKDLKPKKTQRFMEEDGKIEVIFWFYVAWMTYGTLTCHVPTDEEEEENTEDQDEQGNLRGLIDDGDEEEEEEGEEEGDSPKSGSRGGSDSEEEVKHRRKKRSKFRCLWVAAIVQCVVVTLFIVSQLFIKVKLVIAVLIKSKIPHQNKQNLTVCLFI